MSRKSQLSALAKALDKLSSKYPAGKRPVLYTDQDLVQLVQDKYRMKHAPAGPPKRRVRITGKWWEIGSLKRDEVDEGTDRRLQYWFDLASEPNPGVNYWAPYFAELESSGGENWDDNDWKKWRIWYFAQHPEQRAVHAQRKREQRKARDRKRSKGMTDQQRSDRNRIRRERYAEKQREKWEARLS